MENKELVPGLESLLRDFLQIQGFELVELDCFRQGRNLLLRLLVDKPEGGISVGECGQASRRIGELLEEKDLIKESYLLEVNSPGLDRPLKAKADFARCRGRMVKCFLNEPINGKIEIDGKISGVTEEAVEIDSPQGVVLIRLSGIQKAKQVI